IAHYWSSAFIFACSGDSQSFEEVWEDRCSSRAELYSRRGRDNGNSRPKRIWKNHSPNDPLHYSKAIIWHCESDGDRCCRGGHEGSRGYGNRLSGSARVLASQALFDIEISRFHVRHRPREASGPHRADDEGLGIVGITRQEVHASIRRPGKEARDGQGAGPETQAGDFRRANKPGGVERDTEDMGQD